MPDPADQLLSSYSYALPEAFIAQRPVEPRHAARLLVVDPDPLLDPEAGGVPPQPPADPAAPLDVAAAGANPGEATALRGPCRHRTVWDLAEELRPGDLLVVNNTRVLKARLRARRASGGAVELLVLEPAALAAATAAGPAADLGPSDWLCLARPAKRLRPGDVVQLEHPGQPPLALPVIAADGETGGRVVRFPPDCTSPEAIEALLARYGEMPLPPYIHEHDASDEERYQTRYAERPGSVAAPTAGLHLSDALLARLRERGVQIAAVTLHVGLGTFRPVEQEDLRGLELHSEWIQVGVEAVEAVRACRARGGRVIAIGTTSVRTLEAVAALHGGELQPHTGPVNLVIQPGHRFAVVQGLLTNFHLPKSSLLLLVSALIGRRRLLALYEEAKRQGYRFFSYGDAMWIAPEAVLPAAAPRQRTD
ncbi:MAG: tRNA preQ1(34) S-adenosylmethionine ribosyltransferase-isomerase QueA [Cyanobacteriota bacterium]|nr:tRNA preQ1(34) S-adenosylmethionine ribosyltransferase-isomerase QueA [Cyanobacteriota bacterium]